MTTKTDKMTKRSTHNRVARLLIVGGSLVAVAGAVVATGAFGANSRPLHRHAAGASAPRWNISVFSDRARAHARRAEVGAVSAPEGAVYAGVKQVDGVANELYAWHRSPGEDCLVDVEGGREMTTACSPSFAAEAEGISWAGAAGQAATASEVSVVTLVPDGVPTVQVTGADGSTSTVEVTNNVAAYAAASVKELRYTLPDGKVESRQFNNRYAKG